MCKNDYIRKAGIEIARAVNGPVFEQAAQVNARPPVA